MCIGILYVYFLRVCTYVFFCSFYGLFLFMYMFVYVVICLSLSVYMSIVLPSGILDGWVCLVDILLAQVRCLSKPLSL